MKRVIDGFPGEIPIASTHSHETLAHANSPVATNTAVIDTPQRPVVEIVNVLDSETLNMRLSEGRTVRATVMTRQREGRKYYSEEEKQYFVALLQESRVLDTEKQEPLDRIDRRAKQNVETASRELMLTTMPFAKRKIRKAAEHWGIKVTDDEIASAAASAIMEATHIHAPEERVFLTSVGYTIRTAISELVGQSKVISIPKSSRAQIIERHVGDGPAFVTDHYASIEASTHRSPNDFRMPDVEVISAISHQDIDTDKLIDALSREETIEYIFDLITAVDPRYRTILESILWADNQTEASIQISNTLNISRSQVRELKSEAISTIQAAMDFGVEYVTPMDQLELLAELGIVDLRHSKPLCSNQEAMAQTRLVQKAIGELNEEQAHILGLRYDVVGKPIMSVDSLAAELGIETQQVEKKLDDAVQLLLSKLTMMQLGDKVRIEDIDLLSSVGFTSKEDELERCADAQETLHMLQTLINKGGFLTPAQREVINLRFNEHGVLTRSIVQMEAKLGLSRSYISSMIMTATAKLKSEIEDPGSVDIKIDNTHLLAVSQNDLDIKQIRKLSTLPASQQLHEELLPTLSRYVSCRVYEILCLAYDPDGTRIRTVKEVADITGTTTDTVQKQLRSVYKILPRRLESLYRSQDFGAPLEDVDLLISSGRIAEDAEGNLGDHPDLIAAIDQFFAIAKEELTAHAYSVVSFYYDRNGVTANDGVQTAAEFGIEEKTALAIVSESRRFIFGLIDNPRPADQSDLAQQAGFAGSLASREINGQDSVDYIFRVAGLILSKTDYTILASTFNSNGKRTENHIAVAESLSFNEQYVSRVVMRSLRDIRNALNSNSGLDLSCVPVRRSDLLRKLGKMPQNAQGMLADYPNLEEYLRVFFETAKNTDSAAYELLTERYESNGVEKITASEHAELHSYKLGTISKYVRRSIELVTEEISGV